MYIYGRFVMLSVLWNSSADTFPLFALLGCSRRGSYETFNNHDNSIHSYSRFKALYSYQKRNFVCLYSCYSHYTPHSKSSEVTKVCLKHRLGIFKSRLFVHFTPCITLEKIKFNIGEWASQILSKVCWNAPNMSIQ